MPYITCAGKTDGAGAQAHAVISTLLYAKHHGMIYVHTPFSKIERFATPDAVESFFNLGHGEAKRSEVKEQVVTAEHCHAFADQNPDLYPAFIPALKAKYYLTPKRCRFDPSKVNVALHLRRGDVKKDNELRERFTDSAAVRAVQKRIASLPFPFVFHLYSQGTPEDFKEFGDVVLHLDEDPLETFQHLVAADLLVMAKSSYSYVAALLSDGIIIYERFWHSPLPSWLGNSFAASRLGRMIEQRVGEYPHTGGYWVSTTPSGRSQIKVFP